MTKTELKSELSRLANLIDAPSRLVPPVLDKPVEDQLVVVVTDGLIKIVHQERGSVNEFVSTRDPDEALYWVFREIVRSMRAEEKIGSDYDELDKRRYWFKRDRELFEKFKNPQWTAKLESEINSVLRKAPFQDK